MRFTLSALCVLSTIMLCSCASNPPVQPTTMASKQPMSAKPLPNYAERLPSHLNTNGQKEVLVDPKLHVWGAYSADGDLLKAGLATAGSSWCPDIGRPCRTKVGIFHINSLGSAGCKSTIYPIPKGGAPMPYCMFFNKNQGLHGAPESHLAEANLSHGCVRMRVNDAEWLRYNFATVGTKVVVKPY